MVGRPRTKPVQGTLSDEKYALCCALIDLLNTSELSNLEVIGLANLGITPQTFSRHLLGKNGPSEQIVRAIIWSATTEAGMDVGEIHRQFVALRPFLDLDGVVLPPPEPPPTLREIMARRIAPLLARAEDDRAVAVLIEQFGENDGEIALVIAEVAGWSLEACAALLVAFTRAHGAARAGAVREQLEGHQHLARRHLHGRVNALSDIAAAGEEALVRLGETAEQALTAYSPDSSSKPSDPAIARIAALVRHGRMAEALRAWLSGGHGADALVSAGDAARVLWAVMHIDRDGCLVAARLVDAAMTEVPATVTDAVLLNWLPGNLIPGSYEYRRLLRELHPQTFLALVSGLFAAPATDAGRPSRDRMEPAAFLRAVDPTQVLWLISENQSTELAVHLVCYIDVELMLRTLAPRRINSAVLFVARVLRGLASHRWLSNPRTDGGLYPDQRFIGGLARGLCADYDTIALVVGRATANCPPDSAAFLWKLLLGLVPNKDPSLGLVGVVLDQFSPRSVQGLPNALRSDGQVGTSSLSDCFAQLLDSRWNEADGGFLLVRAAHVCPLFTAHALVPQAQSGSLLEAARELVTRLRGHTNIASVVLKHMAAICRRSALKVVRECAPMIAQAAERCENAAPDDAVRALCWDDGSTERQPRPGRRK